MSARGCVRRNAARAFVLGMAALGSACALTSRGEVLDVRTFTPEGVHATATTAVPAGPSLRLGRVTSGPDLGHRIVYGDGAYEVSYYEDRRWTERPSLYLRRALDRTLFEDGGFRRELGGDGPALDAELLVFEEVKTPHAHAARIVARINLQTDHVLFEDTVAVVEPIAGTRFEDVVAAMARALDAISGEIARRVGVALAGSIRAAR
jgi:ABC-type uncharacterized transport system auxiliary subunit